MSDTISFQEPVLGSWKLLDEISDADPQKFGHLFFAKDQDDIPALIQTIPAEVSSNENFLVRFEIIRSLAPEITHPNLLSVLSLSEENNVYYIAKQIPQTKEPQLFTLDRFCLTDEANPSVKLCQILLGIAEGLLALEQIKNSLYPEGIIHTTLHPKKIYLQQAKALIGNTIRLVPQIDGFIEEFLFFGDTDLAHNKYMTAHSPLFQQETFQPPENRQNLTPSPKWHLYTFALIAYYIITGSSPKGILSPLHTQAPHHALIWEPIIEQAFSSYRNQGPFSSIKDVIEVIKEKTKEPSKSTYTPIKIPEPPQGMSYIAPQEKVILGNNEALSCEAPCFRAKISPFFIGTTPVTNQEFEEFMPNRVRSCYSNKDDSPATFIPFSLALAYADWKSEKEGLAKGTYRLPTEYEWEAAARGTTGQMYPWGNKIDLRYCHVGMDKEVGAIGVKERAASRFGLYQMLGNTWEWTSSAFLPHPFSKDEQTRYQKSLRIAKGGCWMTGQQECRASFRAPFSPNVSKANIGFRLVRST